MPSRKPTIPVPEPKREYWDLYICILLLAAIAIAYAQVRHFDFVNFDDADYVSDPHILQGITAQSVTWAFTSTSNANWFPLTRLSHALDFQLFGQNCGPQHVVNVLLHACSALLLFLLLKRMTGARWPSAFVAFVFALHPLHIESVAWVAERKDVLSTLFMVLGLWAYFDYVKRPGVPRSVSIAILFAAAVMSKPMAVTFPLLLLLLDAWPLRRFSRRSVMEKLPLFAIAAAASAVTYLVQQQGGAVASIDQVSFGLRLSNALTAYVAYLCQFFWPADLAVFYPYTATPLWLAAGAALLLAGITALALRNFAQRPYLAIGWLWYLITLLPVIGLVQVGIQARADRYTYVPLIGISIMLAWGAAELRWRTAVIAAGAAAGCALCYLTWVNVSYWQDSVTLFEHATRATSNNYLAYNNLGVALRERGQTAQAMADFQQALSIKPRYAEAANNLGEALISQGRINDAAPYVEAALREEPDSVEAHVNWATILNIRGHYMEAAAEDRTALALQPGNAQAHCGLGVALADMNRFQEAVPQFLDAIGSKPDYADAHYNLGLAYGALGHTPEAIRQFTETVRLQPDNSGAHFNLGTAMAAEDKLNEAIPEFQTAVRLSPDSINARFNLGSALAGAGKYDEAIAEFTEVLRLKPNFIEARKNLEACLTLRKAK